MRSGGRRRASYTAEILDDDHKWGLGVSKNCKLTRKSPINSQTKSTSRKAHML